MATDNGEITLTSGQLVITSDITIHGDTDSDGAADISISGGGTDRVFLSSGAGTDVALRGLDIWKGYSNGSGGAILAYGNTMTIVNSTIRDSDSGDEGGGVFANNVTFSNATIFGNYAGGSGGGVSFAAGGVGNFTNTTLSGNEASSAGGGIFTKDNADLTLLNSTITNNVAGDYGAGISLYTGTDLTITNSIVSGNLYSGGEDIYQGGQSPSFVVAQNSLLGTSVVINLDNGGNISSDTPGLGALALNGGSVQTHEILTGSAAIGAGDASLLPMDVNDVDGDGNVTEALPIDANGVARVSGTPDIGAV